MRTLALIVALAAVVLGGCGGEPKLSAGAADELHAQVAAVREAAQEGDQAAALEALDGLAGKVRDLEGDGSLGETDAAALRRGIGRARRRVRAEVAAPTPAPTATATPTATPEPAQGEPGEGKGKAKGQGKGKEGDED